jgi:hypothetical protein
MRILKQALLLGGFLGMWGEANSMEENEALPEWLDRLFQEYELLSEDSSEDGCHHIQVTREDFEEIENKLGYELPKDLKQFYTYGAHNRKLTKFCPATPNGGLESELYNLIRDAQHEMQNTDKLDWVAFCPVQGNEFFCIHRITGKIRRYLISGGFTENENYENLSAWIERIWLSK